MKWVQDAACTGEDKKCKALVRKTEEKKMPSKTHTYMDTSSSTMLRKRV